MTSERGHGDPGSSMLDGFDVPRDREKSLGLIRLLAYCDITRTGLFMALLGFHKLGIFDFSKLSSKSRISQNKIHFSAFVDGVIYLALFKTESFSAS